MDLSQKKLKREEWEALEVPIKKNEMTILKLIKDGYDNINICYNLTKSLLNFMKIKDNNNKFHEYFYNEYFKKIFTKLVKKYKCPEYKIKISKKIKIKKANKIRIDNSEKKMEKKYIYEYILLNFLEKLVKQKHKKKSNYYYYTLIQLLKSHVADTNMYVIENIKFILSQCTIEKTYLIKNAHKIIEQNKNLTNYKDTRLYVHQKELFNYCKYPNPKIILYQAPTGMGKTISPIGLAKDNKLIFVCAAKHIGLQFARACISMSYPIAVAFGCSDPGDIRLHYYAAKDYVKNRRTGGIFRVDNMVGDKVQIMISDIKSYLSAMRYMLAFNKPENIIWYWDEPTITLDKETHEYHDILSKNWRENEIPNIVLSSATLPPKHEIMSCIQYFKSKFLGGEVYSITNYECTKTIPIIDKNGYIILPHLVYENYEDIEKVINHINEYKTILRHFDIEEITKFIIYVNEQDYIQDRYKIDIYFDEINKIDILEIKLYYLLILGKIKKNYREIFEYFKENRKKKLESYIYLTTTDAHTLTDGPSLYLTDDLEKISQFCIQTAKISKDIMDILIKKIDKNEKIKKKIDSIEKQIKNIHIEETDDKKKDKKNPKVEKYDMMIKELYKTLVPIQLNSAFIPNSHSHMEKWLDKIIENAFTSTISEEIVEKISLLNIDPSWKILLMMGIGVFKQHSCTEYTEIMKKMADDQKLYLIIATTDYIYGTNYQFCHGYLGNDLKSLTQEKMLQAFGRIGRTNTKQNYSLRLRDLSMTNKLLQRSNYKPESNNMNRLFGIQ